MQEPGEQDQILTDEELLLTDQSCNKQSENYQPCDCESELQTIIDTGFRSNESELRQIMKEV